MLRINLFDNKSLTASQLQQLIREDVVHWHLARGGAPTALQTSLVPGAMIV
jgi:hypothetical protein